MRARAAFARFEIGHRQARSLVVAGRSRTPSRMAPGGAHESSFFRARTTFKLPPSCGLAEKHSRTNLYLQNIMVLRKDPLFPPLKMCARCVASPTKNSNSTDMHFKTGSTHESKYSVQRFCTRLDGNKILPDVKNV